MNTLTLEIVVNDNLETREFSFPESFAEFTAKDVRALVRRIEESKTDELWYVKLIRDLVQFEDKDVVEVDDEQFDGLQPYFEYLKGQYINEKSPMEKIGILRGPAFKLKNYSIEQLSYVDSYSQAYMETNDAAHLEDFFAHAYSIWPFDWSPKNENLKWLYKLVTKQTKLAALRNYNGLRGELVQSHPHTFEGGEEDSEMAQFAWTGTLINLAGPKFGPFEQSRKTKVPEAFTLFEMNGIQIKKQKQEAKQNGH